MTDKTPPTKPAGALHAGLDVLEILAAHPEGLGVTAIALELGADKGNIHRVLRSLSERGYAEQDEQTRMFTASAELFRLAGSLLRNQALTTVARPFMRTLSVELGAPVHLARRLRRGGVYVGREGTSTTGVSVETEIGVQPPLHASATGKALFILTTPEELAELLPEELPAFTETTIRTRTALWDEIAHARRVGFTIDREELNRRVVCVAAPVLDYSGAVVGSIGISSLISDPDEIDLDARGRRVADVAALITERLGGKPLLSP